MKISPLIVSTDYRGKLGIGSMLSSMPKTSPATSVLGSCTAPSPPNQEGAFQFFLRGRALSLERVAITTSRVSTSTCCTSSSWTRRVDSPIALGDPPMREKHAEGARKLILSQMDDGSSMEQRQAGRPFAAGEAEGELCDANAKYKIIFTAECGGQVVGTLALHPGEGSAHRLLPLVASSEAAFEALVIDSQDCWRSRPRRWAHV